MNQFPRQQRTSSTRRAKISLLAAAIGLTGLGVSPAWAVDDDFATKLLRTSFASPGARAAGMGGAFIGLADDSSAAFLNPAGIVLLPAVELTVEARYRDTDFDFELPEGADIDNNSSSSLSYLSLVVPYERWGFGVFYGSLGDAASDFELGQGVFFGNPGPPSPTNPQTFPFTSALDLEDRYYGAGFGFKASDNFRLGASFYIADRDLQAGSIIEGGYQLTPTAAVTSYNSALSEVSDRDFGYNLGLHWANTEGSWSAGLSYRSELEFDRDVYVDIRERLANGSVGNLLEDESGVGSSIIPSAITLGLGWRPTPDWVVALDVSFVRFSDILDEERPAGIIAGVPLADGTNYGIADYLDIDNEVEVRLGAEYSFESGQSTWFIRGGIWREADASLRFNSSEFLRDFNGADAFANLFRQVFPRLGGVTHGSAGLGVLSGNFSFDFAVDHSSRDTEVVVSAGYSWE